MSADDPHRDPVRVAAARRGVAAARRRLTIVWDRKSETWQVDGRTFPTLIEAENYITRPTPEGEQ